jgi:hypothetical protein
MEAAGLLVPRPVLRLLQGGAEPTKGHVNIFPLANLDPNSHPLCALTADALPVFGTLGLRSFVRA